MSTATAPRLLEVEDLRTHLFLERHGVRSKIVPTVVRAVDGVTFGIDAGETLGLIGESGSGKTMTGLSLLGLPPRPVGRIVGGSVRLDGRELVGLPERTLSREIRGREIAMISQDPMTSLNPVFTVGSQISAPLRAHGVARGGAALEAAVGELERVGIPAARERSRSYPHEFSGGMRQRVVAAMAIACRPRVLIADEPTSALDVTVQVQFMDLLEEIQRDTGASLLFITHDLGVAASLCHRVAVMYAGRIVETAPTRALYSAPAHPYTRGLLESVPRLGEKRERLYAIGGSAPDPSSLPGGCAFHPRCPDALDVCRERCPSTTVLEEGHSVACWLHEDEP